MSRSTDPQLGDKVSRLAHRSSGRSGLPENGVKDTMELFSIKAGIED